MTREQWREFVAVGTRTGKLATVRADGRPHVAPIWFVLDGEDIVFNTGAATVKGRALRRSGTAALCVDDERAPFSFVTLSGPVRLSEDLGEVALWATRIAARYMGAERAAAYGQRNGVPGELLVRLTPTSVVAQRDIAE
ncbi:PPOX class F420-dependent oxidoreductase [Frankia sp. AgKG'84/4]|uniref:PPOX class F420-dependent oxidoreductase n=1 Tax=Frankia sp. AgKG'84/4 TaxID=573490 RepID=UPI00200F06D4|nr:PPOX class F420-dependent oxidoreductase [Frankia sp. AgKG'84/4]MCL9798300.1 PPOX class F420-dependent oxidoreductase [Frankia sp. AgKG'84/4]